MFKADSRMQESRQRWVKDWEPNPVIFPFTQTRFEDEVKRLGLTPAQYVDSKELKAWVTEKTEVVMHDRDEPYTKIAVRYQEVYIPENLLKAWGLAVAASKDMPEDYSFADEEIETEE